MRAGWSAGLLLLAAAGCGGRTSSQAETDLALFDLDRWQSPPSAFRPYFRWWWPGGNVEANELERELRLFTEQGFGGVEIQPLTLRIPPPDREDPAVLSVGTDAYVQRLQTVCRLSRELGLAVDVTFGSSWPSGGPFVREGAARQLTMSTHAPAGPTRQPWPPPPSRPPNSRRFLRSSGPVAFLESELLIPVDKQEILLAVTAARSSTPPGRDPILEGFTDLTSRISGDKVAWEVPEGNWILFAFYENAVGHEVPGAAYPTTEGSALVADHLGPLGVQDLIRGFGEAVADGLHACDGGLPRSLFIDSFELIAELPWTRAFLDEFSNRKGYDLRPYLPLLFRETGEVFFLQDPPSMPLFRAPGVDRRVREDYEDVRSRLFIENFLEPLARWTANEGMTLRVQAHGAWADYLDAYQIAHIPETEQLYARGEYDFLKLASSAGHVKGRPFVSAETFVGPGALRGLSLEDFYRAAGSVMSAGVNRIVHHGYPYRYVKPNGSPWHPFDLGGGGGAQSWSDENHPVWPHFRALNAYIARLSYALTVGKNEADVAWLHPEARYPGNGRGGGTESAVIEGLGLTFDRVSRHDLEGVRVEKNRIRIGAAEYRALLISNLESAAPELMEAIERVARSGTPVFVLGGLPRRATGWAEREARDARVAEIALGLEDRVIQVASADGLAEAVRNSGIEPPLRAAVATFPFRIVHRSAPNAEVFVLFNVTRFDRSDLLSLPNGDGPIHLLDPRTGDVRELDVSSAGGDRPRFRVGIPADRAAVLLVGYDDQGASGRSSPDRVAFMEKSPAP